jgi:hypothetical protein
LEQDRNAASFIRLMKTAGAWRLSGASRSRLEFLKIFRNPGAPRTKMGYERTTNESWKK